MSVDDRRDCALPFTEIEDAILKETFYPCYILRLPQELLDAIVDCLRKDKRALAHCALTMRSWLHRSRRHLFDNTTTRKPGSLFEFLRDAPSSVTNSMRFLTLRFYDGNHLDLRVLVEAMSKMPSLDQLWMRHFYSMTIPLAHPITALSANKLIILVLDRASLNALELATLVSLFPSLLDLYIETDCSISPQGAEEANGDVKQALAKIKLTKLAFGSRTYDQQPVLDVLRMTSSLDSGTITSLELNFLQDRWLYTAKRALKEYGSHLEHLAVDLTYWIEEDTDNPLKGLGLSACQNLKHLRVDLGSASKITWLRAILFDALPRLGQDPLRVDVAIDASELSDVNDKWDNVLSAYRAQDVSSFRIWCRTSTRCDDRSNAFKRGRLLDAEEQAKVCKLLPETNKAGLLKFT